MLETRWRAKRRHLILFKPGGNHRAHPTSPWAWGGLLEIHHPPGVISYPREPPGWARDPDGSGGGSSLAHGPNCLIGLPLGPWARGRAGGPSLGESCPSFAGGSGSGLGFGFPPPLFQGGDLKAQAAGLEEPHDSLGAFGAGANVEVVGDVSVGMEMCRELIAIVEFSIAEVATVRPGAWLRHCKGVG